MSLIEKQKAATLVTVKNILFAIDFSPLSTVVLSHVAAIARRFESKVYLAHVVRSEMYPLLLAPEAVVGNFEGAARQANRLLKEVSEELEGIPNESLLGRGEVVATLMEMIKDHNIDLVVVGTHGRHGLKRFLLGSIAEELFRTSPCPVLTIGPRVPIATREAAFRHILYPTDLSEESFCAAPYALSLACQDLADLTVLHVLPQATGGYSGMRGLVKEFRDEMKKLVPAEEAPWCNPECEVKLGEPAETIRKVATETMADVIVLGVRQADPLSYHLERNIAYQVVASAECPVLTIHADGVEAH
jgi:nucleotide-binding universal stress UspA family protein